MRKDCGYIGCDFCYKYFNKGQKTMITFLEVGDWSRDGHNMSDIFMVEHNAESKEALMEAYKRGCEKIGFDLKNEVATRYEESFLTLEQYEKLMYAGLSLEHVYVDNEDSVVYIDPEIYVELWMEIAAKGFDGELTWEVTELSSEAIHAGGYGLFCA